MARDSTLPVRRGIIAGLAANPTVTAIVPAARIYPMTAERPGWPFILYGASTPLPLRATCLDGCEITVALHGFAKARYDGAKRMIETAEDHAGRLGAALAKACDGMRFAIPGGTASVRWTGSQLLVDGGEADAFHAVVNLRVRAITSG